MKSRGWMEQTGAVGRVDVVEFGRCTAVSNPVPGVTNVAPRATNRVNRVPSMVGGAAGPPPSQLISRRPPGYDFLMTPLLAPRSAELINCGLNRGRCGPEASRTTRPATPPAARDTQQNRHYCTYRMTTPSIQQHPKPRSASADCIDATNVGGVSLSRAPTPALSPCVPRYSR
jgi:hypothetical protein